MSNSIILKTIQFVFALGILTVFGACNKKCKSLKNTETGSILNAYDFKDCYVYATFDSTLLIRSDSAFTAYKQKQFIHCTPSSLDAVDFSKNMIIGYKIKVNACNVGFHRNISIDTTAKTFNYNIEYDLCRGCGAELTGTNIVVAPQIPLGYTLKFSSKERQ